MRMIKHISKQALCWVLSLTIALQPNLVEANSSVITVDPSTPTTSVDVTINGTPLLQIKVPNASGVSHNKFTNFNVGSQGLVINNATTNTTTNIGGAILSNPNFSGTAASLILNEVTSANRSSLTGFTEIGGTKADYILANPNGITCNGCGFINTSRSTLTTGTPTFSGTSLESLSVTAGDIVINSLGLNANEADAFDIITRAAEISGAINAQELRIIAGRNDVKYSDRTVTKKVDDGSTKPTLAIDSSALGGMYAGRIALIANETGVGVNMQGDMAASTNELTITADGRIDFKKATAKTDLTVTSNDTVDVATRAYAENNLSITAPTIDATDATLAAANDVTLSGTTITGTNAQVIAGLNSDGSSAAQGDVSVTAIGTFAYDGGTVRAGETLTINADQINGGASSNGITSLGNTTISGTTSAAVSGNLSVGGNLSLTGGALSTTSGTGDVTGTATINGTSYSGTNALEATGNITVTTTGDTTIQTGGGLTSTGAVTVNAANITSDGTISSQTGTTLTATQALTTTTNAKTQSGTNTTLTSTNDMTLGGTTTATNELTITAPSLTNNGTIADGTTDGASINITSNLTNSGLIYASGDMKLIVPLTLLNDEGQILAGGNIQIDKDGAGTKNTKVWNYSGNIESLNGGIVINTEDLTNERKSLVETTVTNSSSSSTSVQQTITYAGPNISGDGSLYSSSAVMGNDGVVNHYTHTIYRKHSSSNQTYSATSTSAIPKIISSGDMTIAATNIANKSGQILTNSNLSLTGTNLTNTGYASATVTSSSTTNASIGGGLDSADNTYYIISAGSTSSSSSATVTDPGDTFITAGGNITGSFTGSIDNVSVKTGADAVSITEGSANVNATSADIGTPTTDSINSGLTLPTGSNGLFVQTTDPTSEFVIETNPAVATLGALYGSSYFETKMGINLADEVKRLGNDDYETRLVRDQIMAVTHQRFLSNAVTNDSDQYLALMNSALAQKDGLQLSYGVELSAEQVQALTNDLVWMVEVTLENGQKALKPVVYFAEATRMAIDSSGALIVAGGDLNLSADGDINNSGTLSGDNTTLASTGGSIINEYGKLAASNGDLSVTADQNITNTGGLITGDNVTLAATNGTFTNQTETWRQSETRISNINWDRDKILEFNDTIGAKGRIKATGGNIEITAGKDITDTGQTDYSSTGNTTLNAGENITLNALQTKTRTYDLEQIGEHVAMAGVETTTNTGANLTAGGNINITSGQQTVLQGVKADAGGDLAVSSGTDTIITASQTTQTVETGDWGQGRLWSTEDTNQLADLKAANDLTITSGLDTVANGVKLEAGNDLSVSSLASTTITSPQDSFEQDIKGSKGYMLKVDKKTTVRSELVAGNDISVRATLGDVTLKSAQINAGGKVTLAATNGDVNLTANKDVDFRHESGSKEGGMWTTVFDKGHLDETVQHTTIDAGDGLTITVGTNGSINVDYKDFGDLDKSVERLSQEPGLEWIAQVKAGATDAQWNAIKEAHKSWDYSSQSLSPQAAMIIAIAASIATMGAAAGAATTMMGLAEGAVMTTTQTAIHAALTAGMTSLASSAAVSLVGNKGDLGATLKQLGSSSTLRSMATAMVSAGLVAGIGNAAGFDMSSTAMPDRIKVAALKMSVNTVVDATIGGGDFGDALKSNLISAGVNVAASVAFEQIGDMAAEAGIPEGEIDIKKVVAHAVASGVASELAGGDFAAGAAAGAAAEVANGAFSNVEGMDPAMQEQIAGLIAAGVAAVAGGDAQQMQLSSQIANIATKYNRQLHTKEILAIKEMAQNLSQEKGGSVEEWQKRLGQQALRQADSNWASVISEDADARNILTSFGDSTFVDEYGRQVAYFQGGDAFDNHARYAGYILDNEDFYNSSLGLIRSVSGREDNVEASYLALKTAARNANFQYEKPEEKIKVIEDLTKAVKTSHTVLKELQALQEDTALSEDTRQYVNQVWDDLNQFRNGATSVLKQATVEAVRTGALDPDFVENAKAMMEIAGLLTGGVVKGNFKTGQIHQVNLNSIPTKTFKSTSGITIKTDPNKTTTILGSYNSDMKRIIDTDLKYPKTLDFEAKPGSFNVLNAPNFLYKNDSQFWKEYNKPFLEAAINRGDRITIATKPTNDVLWKFQDGKKVRTGYGKEYDLLKERGYELDLKNNTWIKVE